MTQSRNVWVTIFTPQGRGFTSPHPEMSEVVQLLEAQQANTVFDLGNGSGSHLIFFAQHGFSVHGLDPSPEAIRSARQQLVDEGLDDRLDVRGMDEGLPYENALRDAVVVVQAIRHSDPATIRTVV